MLLKVKRIAKKETYTIGHLYIDGEYFCDTLEDKDRGLNSNMKEVEIKAKKIAHETAIPTGTYNITLDVKSPKFGSQSKYKFCEGKLPRLLDVKGYAGVLIHIGNMPKDTDGCILVGQNKAVGQVLSSTTVFTKLYKVLQKAKNKGDKIQITIE